MAPLTRRSFLGAAALAAMRPARALAADLAGEIRLVGYNDMAEMIAALDAAFTARHPAVLFRSDLRGTRTGPPALADGRASIAPMGARFTPAQRIAYRAATGVDPASFRIAHASLSPKALSGPNAIFVHRDNPLVDAELPDLARMFTEAGPHLWGELGATGPMARAVIKLAGLLPETPLALELADALFPGRGFATEMVGYGQSRDVIAFVGSEPLSLGFAALNRASDSVRAFGLRRNAAAPAVFASAATLRSGAYPLDRHLWLYARQDCDGHLEPLPRAYIDFAMSEAGQMIIGAGSLGYIPLGSEERRAERARLG